MEDLAVVLYRKRREERLASRGVRIKKKQYRKSKDGRKLEVTVVKPEYHNDAEDTENAENSGGEGAHGNTKLPFGLCQRYGIEIESGWTPRDAWDALAGKGITPEGAYKKLRAGEEITPDEAPDPPKNPLKTIDKGTYYIKDIKARHGWGSRGTTPWVLEGTPEWKEGVSEEEKKTYRSGYCGPRFATLTDAYIFLKRAGIEEFEDPETGEIVNPSEMDLPEPVWEDSGHGYSEMSIGLKKDRYAIYGTDFDGKKVLIAEAGTLDLAQERLIRMGVPMDAVKLSPALKKREEERVGWITSDKKEYIDIDGEQYGDLTIVKPKRDYYWSTQTYIVRGESRNGEFYEKEFDTKEDALYFLKEQGVEKARGEDKKSINPQEQDLPKAVAFANGRYCTKLYLETNGEAAKEAVLYGVGLDGEEFNIEYLNTGTYNAFLEKLEEQYGITDDMIEKSDEVKEQIKKRVENEAEKDTRRKQFAEKAIPFAGRKFMDIELRWAPSRGGGTDSWMFYGYGDDGEGRAITGPMEMGDAIENFIEKFDVDPSQIKMDDETKKKYEDTIRRKEEFETKSEQFGDHRYSDIELVKEVDGIYRLYGYDKDGKLRRLTYSGGFYEVMEEMERKGVTDPSKYIKSEEIKDDYKKYQKHVAEFEKKAVDVGGKKYSDIIAMKSLAGYYSLSGMDIGGNRKDLVDANSMHELVTEAKKKGVEDIRSYFKYDEDRQEYDDYMKVQKRFASEAEEFAREKYLDLEIDYDPDTKKYRLYGTNIRGERAVPVEMATEPNFRAMIEAHSGKSLEDFKCSDRMKERLVQVKAAKDAIASGEYYDMGVDGHAFKDIFAEKLSDKWSIKGTDEKGRVRSIATVNDWDDAITAMEDRGVTGYKMLTKDRTYERPTDGMRHVVLARDKNGTYRVFADSATRGTHAEVYTAQTEQEARKWLSDNNVDSSGLKTRGMNPNDDVPRTHTQKSLENFDTHRMGAIDGSIIDDMNDSEKQEAAEMLKTLFKHGTYRCARSTRSFGLIIDDRYKSQVETGTGGFGASKNVEGRKKCSKRMFGHGNIEDREYEKCGYLGASDDEYDYDMAGVPMYGGTSDCVYTFKKDRMVDRASYTFGDSLNTYGAGDLKCAGYAGENPTLEGLTAVGSVLGVQRALKEYRRYKKGEIEFNEMFRSIKTMLNNCYIEMQFNGDVTVEDIEKVTFRRESNLKNAFDSMDSDMRKRVIQKLRSNNVQLLYRKDRHSAFIDAWSFIKSNYPDDYFV